MSLEASGWAWGQKVPGNQKLVLLALADFMHHETDTCWASVDYLADKCSIARSTLKRALKALDEADLIEIESRGNRTNIYRLKPKAVGVQNEPASSGVQYEPLRGSNRTSQGFNMNLSGVQSEPQYSKDTVTNTTKDTGMASDKKKEGRPKATTSKKKQAPKTVTLPASLNSPDILEAWAAYIEMRRKKRKEMTDFAAKLIIRKLERMGANDALTSLHNSITAGWTDVYEPKDETTPKGKGNGSESVWELKQRISALEEEVKVVENRGYIDAWGLQLDPDDKKERNALLQKKRELIKCLAQT